MEVITITNQKGGVGKTTTALMLATGLVNKGFKVLAVDLDPQTNFTFTAGVKPDDIETDVYQLFKQVGKREILSLKAVYKSPLGFDLLPGSLGLAGADMEFIRAGREYIMQEILEPLKENYDFCIIDTPPTLGILTLNALTTSNKIIVPMETAIYALQGLSQLQGLIENVKKYCNNALELEGLLINKYDARAIINRTFEDSLEDVAKRLNTKVFKSRIRQAIAIKEVEYTQENLFEAYKKANVTTDFEAFIDEFLAERKEV